VDELTTLARDLGFESVTPIPVSALLGENVVERSAHLEWYDGPTVLQALEACEAGSWTHTRSGSRLPIQWVLRQNGGGRTYAGMLNGATLHEGDTVTLLPANIETTITSITSGSGSRTAATAGLSIDVSLAAETDAGRGDLLATAPLPTVTKEFTATICWFGEQPWRASQRLRLKHTTKVTPVRLRELSGVVDIETLSVHPGVELAPNDIGLVTLQTADFLVVDDYRDNRVTGGRTRFVPLGRRLISRAEHVEDAATHVVELLHPLRAQLADLRAQGAAHVQVNFFLETQGVEEGHGHRPILHFAQDVLDCFKGRCHDLRLVAQVQGGDLKVVATLFRGDADPVERLIAATLKGIANGIEVGARRLPQRRQEQLRRDRAAHLAQFGMILQTSDPFDDPRVPR
jgi:hypothetical protein